MFTRHLLTPAKSAALQEANARSALAAGRSQRSSAENNTEAFKAIKSVCVKYTVPLNARGMPIVVMHGAELICERLAVIVEVSSLSGSAPASPATLDDVAFISKRRDAVLRVAPGNGNLPFRAKFGIHEPVRAKSPATVKAAAQMLLAGKKAFPKSRAAKLITADDEKRLRAIIKSITATAAELKQARTEGQSRTTERDILNTALELFYDDFAASIGLVLEEDEVARLQALELVPRRVERRAPVEAPVTDAGAAPGASSGASSSSASQALAGSHPRA